MINYVLLLLAILAVFPGLFAIGICWRLRAAADSRLRNAVVRHPLLSWAAGPMASSLLTRCCRALPMTCLSRSNGAEQITGEHERILCQRCSSPAARPLLQGAHHCFWSCQSAMFGLGFFKRKAPLFRRRERKHSLEASSAAADCFLGWGICSAYHVHGQRLHLQHSWWLSRFFVNG